MKSIIRTLPVNLLILLFVYAAVSKLADLHGFRGQLHNQPIPKSVADLLLYAVPVTELGTVVLLSLRQTIRLGLFFSLGLMIVFTGYTGLALLHFWSRMPCSCGGVLSHMGWRTHFIFNLFFLLLSLLGLYYPLADQKTNDLR